MARNRIVSGAEKAESAVIFHFLALAERGSSAPSTIVQPQPFIRWIGVDFEEAPMRQVTPLGYRRCRSGDIFGPLLTICNQGIWGYGPRAAHCVLR